MKPSRHIIVSLSLSAALWFFTRSFYAALLCLGSGLFLDADHIIEYIIHFGWKGLNYDHLYHVCENTEKNIPGIKRFKKLYLLFHSVEVLILLWLVTIVTKNMYILAMALGYSSHIALDIIGNRAHPSSYFLIIRAMKGFHVDKILKEKNNLKTWKK